jgi:hypothetical protein
MPFAPLASVRSRLVVGAPLPCSVYDNDQTLLLARGKLVGSHEQLDALFERGALADVDELLTPGERLRRAPREALPRLWNEGLGRINQALMTAPTPSFTMALDEAAGLVLGLVTRDPDLAIFQVLRQAGGPDVEYGVRRSTHTAITSYLVAQRLAWEPGQLERVFKVALTMNMSMLALQGQLARHQGPLSPEVKAEIATHPMRSVELLAHAGIRDDDWLQAVARHHEVEDGSGYPTGRTDVGELASLVRRADVYTSKLSSRSHRDAVAADQAGRQMFMQDPGHPMTAALVKEFGIYPPGCMVRLSSGAMGIVVQRGPTVTTPVVACLTSPRGVALTRPERVDTSQAGQSVHAVVGESSCPVRVSPEKLLAMTIG